MDGMGKELVRWLLGGGALAAASFLATTAYQQGQLQIEHERYLRDFLGRYVELATKGTLDERIRFVQYWESLNVSDQIGVDLTMYKKALATEFNEADRFAAQMIENKAAPPAEKPPAPSRPSQPRRQPPLQPNHP